MCYSVLLDTVSIQQYIFSSSKLKDNIGASFLVEQVYHKFLRDALIKTFKHKTKKEIVDVLRAWYQNPDQININNTTDFFEVGYIGGGNALVLFNEIDRAKFFIKEWTRSLLVIAPGLVTANAMNKQFDPEKAKQGLKQLVERLEENKNKYIPQTVIQRHGITAECSRSGYSMESWLNAGEDSAYISDVSMAKIAASRYANRCLENKFKESLETPELKLCFSDKLEDLGHRKKEDSHIAIVHIDGNEMGKRFKEKTTLPEIRKLSIGLTDKTEFCMKYLIETITKHFEDVQTALGYDTDEKRKNYPTKQQGKPVIPLRPLVIGGDDVTFVCNGKLGVYLAKLFLEKFTEKDFMGKPLSACAGIAITKEKYPFYRGYELAEQLCTGAKRERLKKESMDSWLDFHIALGGFSGTLEEIRSSHYQVDQGSLLFRPFYINDPGERNFNIFIKETSAFYDKDTSRMPKKENKIPRSKWMKLRDILYQGDAATQSLIEEFNARGLKLPKLGEAGYHEKVWENSKTPYFDMIELVEFYPSFELKKNGGSKDDVQN
jgi:hypothetical protein